MVIGRGAEAVEQYREHDQGHDDIGPVALERERDDRERHARNGRRQQQQQAELDEAAPIERARVPHDPRHPTQVGRLAVKDPIVRHRRTVLRQVQSSTKQHDRRGEDHADPQEVADDLVHSLVGPSGAAHPRTSR